MEPFPFPIPEPDDWRLDWEALVAAWPWLRSLAGCPQDPVHHAEGDVWVHTRMVCEAMAALPGWRGRDAEERALLLAAALLHDVAKPATTRSDAEGRVTAPGHSRRGELMTRGMLWRMGVPFQVREQVAALVRHHQYPFYLVEREDSQRVLYQLSQSTRCDHLALLAESDLRGRVCEDPGRVLDAIALFTEYASGERCLDQPRAFPSDHSRVAYFHHQGRDPEHLAYDDTRCEMVLLSGLPGSGKDTWLARNFPGWPVVCLDDLREELGVDPSGEQGAVVQRSKELARGHLRAARSFVWNATNLTRKRRGQLVALARAYSARVRIVYIEAPHAVLLAQNRARRRVVPERVLARMVDQWEVPDRSEAHEVEYVVQGERADGG
ncbi:MAG: AAA family ATPase [Deltaproteobacteria bacterium]|nr:AAA family ATPase [Deltaproteobacteria bacterium]